jgi:hypothetical protein
MRHRKPKTASHPASEGTRSDVHSDWKASTLGSIRALIQQAAPSAIEEMKWKKPSNPAGVPVWSDHGIICTVEAYKTLVRLTFARGAALPDPSHLFNSGLDGNLRRAIVIQEGDLLNVEAFRELIRTAVTFNTSSASP